jgi:hypothetical protein
LKVFIIKARRPLFASKLGLAVDLWLGRFAGKAPPKTRNKNISHDNGIEKICHALMPEALWRFNRDKVP